MVLCPGLLPAPLLLSENVSLGSLSSILSSTVHSELRLQTGLPRSSHVEDDANWPRSSKLLSSKARLRLLRGLDRVADPPTAVVHSVVAAGLRQSQKGKDLSDGGGYEGLVLRPCLGDGANA